jgi:hypothetical protein
MFTKFTIYRKYDELQERMQVQGILEEAKKNLLLPPSWKYKVFSKNFGIYYGVKQMIYM